MLNTTDKIIKHKTGLLNLAEELGNVSEACRVMGNAGIRSGALPDRGQFRGFVSATFTD